MDKGRKCTEGKEGHAILCDNWDCGSMLAQLPVFNMHIKVYVY